jgi:predicted amidohydrolase YtcJ
MVTLPDTGSALLVQGGRLPDWPATTAAGGMRIVPGRQVDVRIERGTVTAVGPDLAPRGDEDVLVVPDSVVLPGLHDHHLHLRAMVAANRSVAVGPAQVRDAGALSRSLRAAPVDGSGWRRAVGYHESVAGDLDRAALDALCPGVPVRVQHRSGAMWAVNSAGVDALGLDDAEVSGIERDATGRPTGRLWRMDAWLAGRLAAGDPAAADPAVGLGSVAHDLATKGVTGVTDATPGSDTSGVRALVRAVERGDLPHRLHVMCPPSVDVPVHARVSRGPHKVVLDDEGLPSLQDFADLVRATHDEGSPVAVHCVTAVQLALALAAFGSAGAVAGDRIEHGSVIDPGTVGALQRLGLTVVTNPGFVHARGDAYLDDVDERDVPHLYRCASLLAGGVAVGAGTDAPFGPADPWTAIRAAVSRRTGEGRTVGAAEAVSLEEAVALFTGTAASPGRLRRCAAGQPGDLCVLAGGAVPEGGAVLATVVAGSVVHHAA